MIERNLKKLAKMKTKSFFILISFILLITLIIWVFNTSTPHLRNIVSETEEHIKNINSKLNVLEPNERKKDLEVDSTYLELLGFLNEPKMFKENNLNPKSNNEYKESSLNKIPPLVTAFSRFSDKEKQLIDSKLKYFFNDLLLIYDLDLSSSEQLKIKKLCNSSCTIKTFKGDNYPDHLVEEKMKAYKPIIIQEVLNEYGAIIWIEPPNVFTSNKIERFLNKSKENGLLAWPLSQPVSQMTHPSMFKYFNTRQKDYYFVHMLDTSQFILYNNKKIHEKLMLPWVKCALKEKCIAPAGSKYNGCDFNRRPYFLYSGCHRYEKSAFSILAALLYNFDHSKYTILIDENNQLINTSSAYTLNSYDSNKPINVFIETYYENSFMTQIHSTTKKLSKNSRQI